MKRPRIHKGDTILIITGKDRGKKGKVLEVIAATHKVVVEGLNLGTRHVRARRERQKGQRIEFARPMDLSNVMLIDPKDSKPTRVGVKRDGKKIERIARRSGQVIS